MDGGAAEGSPEDVPVLYLYQGYNGVGDGGSYIGAHHYGYSVTRGDY